MTAHKHAAILAQAAEDAKTDENFYEKWEFRSLRFDGWGQCSPECLPGAYPSWDYRRKPAKPRECWAGWRKEQADAERDPWGSAFPMESKPLGARYPPIHMIEVTPEVRAALAAAGIEVSQ